MSDTVLRIIPTDPAFVPTREAAVGAEEMALGCDVRPIWAHI